MSGFINYPWRPCCLLGFIALSSLVLLFGGCANLNSAAKPLTFIQMTDPQLGMTSFSKDLDNFQQAIIQASQTDAAMTVICGDLVNTASDSSFKAFNQAKAAFNHPVFCVPGNHDLGSADSIVQYRNTIGPDYYCRVIDGYAFVFINSTIILRPVPQYSSEQEQWLCSTLTEYKQKKLPVIVVMHHPLFDKQSDEPDGYFNFPQPLRKQYLKLFKDGGVVAVLHGHTHQTRETTQDGIIFASCETTSKNFDGKPLGFRIWQIKEGKLNSQLLQLKTEPVKIP
jgi:3',5'-cyclic AMP phosphodiesterase CpdA